ncbi:MAG TPA: beta-glycosidase, partial [Rikenellaceae bacterium]|nr:beta-glycosidase [Rikenellaceae bacterium]
IAVHIIKPAHYAAVKEKNAESPDFNGGQLGADNPTFHATVGWDWMPTVRGRDMGIWNDVRIEKVQAVTLSDPLVQSKVVDDLASMTVSVNIADVACKSFRLSDKSSAPKDQNISGTLKGTIGDIEFSKKVQLKAGESGTVIFTPEECPQLKNQKIGLWWPNGYGEPTLHKASFSFVPDGESEVMTSIEWQAGIREFTYKDVMSDLKMYINGHRFYPKGGNWGFSEYNLRYGAKEYDTAVRMHKEMNLNMIRNWVGQTGDEEFYDACDKYGIVVWQDFWLANPADGPDPDDNEMFLDNAWDYVSLIRNHPSIGLYCGRNEGYPPAALNKGLIETVRNLHSDIEYIPSSADDGVSGHGPYRAVEPSFYFDNPTTKFHSERGMPAIMEYESLSQMLTSDHLWPTNDVWGQHDFTRTGAQGDTAFVGMVRRRFGDQALESAETFAKYSQWINYDGYRAMYEANNVGRKGLLIWMSHSAWPSLAWQTYDYWFRPTAACAAVKKACEPIHIQMNPASGKIEVINAGPVDLENLTASVSVITPEGEKVYSKTALVSPKEDTTTPVIDLADVPDGLCIVNLRLTSSDGKIISENRYFRNFHSGKDTGNYQALVGTKWLDETLLRF